MDVISLAKSGYINTVATLGTALTSSQAKIIASEFKEVVICYDSDGAGRNATNKAIKILREHEIAVSVLNLKDKKDPDEYINTYGVARFDNCLSKRKSDMMYLIDTLEEEYDVTQNSDKVAFVGSMMEYLKLIKNPVELDVYVEELSERTRVSANAIYSQLGIVKAVTATESGSRSETPDVNMIARRKTPLSSDAALERTRQLMLSLLISHKSVYKSKRQSINPNLFENETHKKLLNFIMAFYDIDKNIEPLQVIDFFTDENEIKEVSLILSLDNMTDDADKAFDDYLKVITDRMNRKNILNQLNGNNPDKIEKLNKIIKNQ